MLVIVTYGRRDRFRVPLAAYYSIAVLVPCPGYLSMSDDTIAEVGIDEKGQLFVRPTSISFDFIYRAGTGVKWDGAKRQLFASKPRELNYVDWFKQILASAVNEYGTTLKLTTETIWTNVPAPIKKEIEARLGA
jgi:hypothetical protein